MQKKLFQLLPFFFFFGLWFIFASPYFFQGRVPFPATYQVNHFHPWSLDQKNWGPVKNGAMPDIIDQIYPWRHFSVQEIKQGRLPWWNPNSFSGNPHIANVQSAAFSPMNTLFFFLHLLKAGLKLLRLRSRFRNTCVMEHFINAAGHPHIGQTADDINGVGLFNHAFNRIHKIGLFA